MDALADVLQPYKEVVGTVASMVTMAQMGTGILVCWDIYKKGSTQGMAAIHFLGGFLMGVMSLKFAFILGDNTMIRTNTFGMALNLFYLSIFFIYSEDKFKVLLKYAGALALSAVYLTYAAYEDPELVEDRLGTIMSVFMFYLIVSPLFQLKNIIKSKSTQGMPFPMILGGSAVTFMWLLYGIVIRNKFLVLQNMFAFTMCASQLALFVIYPSKPQGKDKTKKSKKAV